MTELSLGALFVRCLEISDLIGSLETFVSGQMLDGHLGFKVPRRRYIIG